MKKSGLVVLVGVSLLFSGCFSLAGKGINSLVADKKETFQIDVDKELLIGPQAIDKINGIVESIDSNMIGRVELVNHSFKNGKIKTTKNKMKLEIIGDNESDYLELMSIKRIEFHRKPEVESKLEKGGSFIDQGIGLMLLSVSIVIVGLLLLGGIPEII